MPIKKTAALFVFIQLFLSCSQMEVTNSEVQIIPKPLSQTIVDGKFVINNATGISYPEVFKISGEFLRSYIENGMNIKFQDSKDIEFVADPNVDKQEGYKLNVLPSKIEIRASTDQGAFYAVQSLRQLFPAEFENGSYANKNVAIQCVSVEDEPQFRYRGMHLDVGRHMYSVEFIKKYIDAIAMLKMNTFHWHLTEDQGWRIEIKKYPRLQEISAFRDETLVGHYSDQPHKFDGKRYGGFYTQEEIKSIVTYAEEHHITIIPEIEMPGHSQAAIAAYPELGCSREPVKVATKWGVFEEVYCPNQKTFGFLEDVLDEVIELFPSEYIHIGGDEAPKTRWKECSNCQQLIKREGLKDEHELQNYFITKIEKYLNSKGRQIIGWDEILEGGLAPNATVMSWRGMNGAIEAAKQHHNVIMTPTSHCYFDYYQSDNDDEPLAIGGYLPLEKVYGFNPIPDELSKEEAQYVLGAQGNVWTEYMPTEQQVEYMAFPRMLAMSEVVWTSPQSKNYEDFVSRVEYFNKRLDALDVNYANHLYEVEGKLINDNDEMKFVLNTLTKGKTIRVDLNGNEPKFESSEYIDPIVVDTTMTIKAAVFELGGKNKIGKTFTQNIDFHKAVGKKININVEPHKAYSGSGKEGLINGISGSDSRYGDKEWLGFWGDDVEITIDFDEPIEINAIKTRFHNGNGQWIYAPKEIELIYLLEEGSKVIDLNRRQLQLRDNKILELDCEFPKPENLVIKVKTLTLKIPNYGIIPEGKQGAGNKAWTFIDEIIVN